MKKVVSIAFAALLLLGFSACRATKKIQQVIVKKDTVAVVDTPVLKLPTHEDTVRMANEVLANVEKKYISFNTFSAKIKVDYSNSKGRQPDFVANKRFKLDMFNVVLGIIAQCCLTILPMYIVLWMKLPLFITIAVLTVIVVVLKYTWWNKLED